MMLSSLRIAKSLDDGLDADFGGTGLGTAVRQQPKMGIRETGIQKTERGPTNLNSLSSQDEAAMYDEQERTRKEKAEEKAQQTRKEEKEEQAKEVGICALM